jgi:large subunit ribosomal protein L9
MKVILRQDIDTLGDKNEIKNVAAGYARNFLIPRGMAVAADDANLKDLDRRLLFAKRRESKLEQELAKAADKIRNAKIEISARAGVEGKLYGSVSAKEIAAALTEKFKYEIDKKRIKLQESLRRVGEYNVPLKLKDGLTVDIVVTIVPNELSDKPEEIPQEPEAPAEGAEVVSEAPADETAEEKTEE